MPTRRQLSEAEAGAKQEALERMEELRAAMLRALEILHAVQALFAVKPEVTRAEFGRFVHSALERLPELQALEWIPRVTDAERSAYEQAARADGLTEFQFTEITADEEIAPAQPRSEYLPIFYAEPAQPNAQVLGLDLRANSCRRQALEQAAATGLPTATSPLRLAQLAKRSTGFFVVMSVRGPAGELLGFCLAVFRVERLVNDVFAPLLGRGVRVEIRDLTDATGPIYAAAEDPADPDGWSYEQDMPIVGRTWRFNFRPTSAFRAADPNWLRRAAETLQRTNQVLEERVAERTAQLAELNATLQQEIEVRKAAEAAAEHANRAKSLFLAEMSHEIRTPLNVILGYTQLLQRGMISEAAQAEAVSAIVEGSNHLLCLVDGVLDLTKIETGRMDVAPVDFDLSMLVKGLAAMFGPRCQQRGLRFRLEGLGANPVWLRGDERKLRQVLANLLGNAVKFTDAGEVRLRVVPVGAPGTYRFEVIDTGAGISASAQRAIFEPFHQESEGRAKGGTGLGLSIARRLIEMMGGELALNSAPGWGSNFFFALAFAPSRNVVTPSAQAPFSSLRLAAGCRVRALVLDAHPMNREVLVQMLRALGCEAEGAASGADALDLAEAHAADVVFLDVRLPDLDRIASTRVRWRDTATLLRRSRLVAYSALAFEHEREAVGAAGFDDHMVKPFRFERITECLARLLGVTFEKTSLAPSAAAMEAQEAGTTAFEFRTIQLPESITAPLRAAAEIGDFAELRRRLAELTAMPGAASAVAQRLRVPVQRFDNEAVLALLGELEVTDSDA